MNTIVQSIGHILIIGQCTSTSLTIIVQNNWQDLSSHQTLQDECSSGTLLTCLTCHIGMLAMGIVVTFATWYHCTRLHLSVWGCYCPSPVRLTSQQQFDQQIDLKMYHHIFNSTPSRMLGFRLLRQYGSCKTQNSSIVLLSREIN